MTTEFLSLAAGPEHHHFTYGMINPVMAFFFSIAGSYLGLTCARFARAATNTATRIRWIALSSFAIGGIGIWMMHFAAMIGFTVDGKNITYDLGVTALSFVIAVISVAVGLWIAGTRDQSWFRLIPAGTVCGAGVASMHYTGMAAMNFAGRLDYNTAIVASSIAIAVVASTVALRFSAVIARRGSMLAASVIMAIAVCGMHYTGMLAIVVSDAQAAPPGGIEPLTLIIPILILAAVGIIGLIIAVLGAPQDAVAPINSQQSKADAQQSNASVPRQPTSLYDSTMADSHRR
ncbi:MHYT domain-containing protein [Haloglycomyces albus]|uniref:MHYT domain-containing protein n=1 Tax=Haloglycomyces albus TaxID=526067 RepID=UPI00046CEE06|nr:MHYT domain-containing protein [Haloglycomyces albus]